MTRVGHCSKSVLDALRLAGDRFFVHCGDGDVSSNPMQILRHRQGLEEIVRQRDLAIIKRQKTFQKSSSVKFKEKSVTDETAQMAVVEHLAVDGPVRQLQVGVLE